MGTYDDWRDEAPSKARERMLWNAAQSRMAERAGEYPDEPKRLGRVSQQMLDLVRASGRTGLTQREASAALSLGHGSTSGALTRLHRGDLLARLAEKRRGQYVYVIPTLTEGRALSAYTPHKGTGTNIAVDRSEVTRVAMKMRYSTDSTTVLAHWLAQQGVQVR